VRLPLVSQPDVCMLILLFYFRQVVGRIIDGESGAKRRHCHVRSWEIESWEIRIRREREGVECSTSDRKLHCYYVHLFSGCQRMRYRSEGKRIRVSNV
jgi:hypothetical protein